MRRTLVLLSVASVLSIGMSAHAVTITNLNSNVRLFYDNFEGAPSVSTVPAIDGSNDHDPVAVTGTWSVGEGTGSEIQATSSTTSPDPGPFQGANYLRIYRDDTFSNNEIHALTPDQSTGGQVIRFESMVYVGNDVNHRGAILLEGTPGTFSTARVYVYPFGNGFVGARDTTNTHYDTGVPYTVGVWQRWIVDYAIGASTFSLSVDGNSASGLTAIGSGNLGGARLFNGSATAGNVYFDAVPEPSSAVLLLFGGLGLAATSRRRKSKGQRSSNCQLSISNETTFSPRRITMFTRLLCALTICACFTPAVAPAALYFDFEAPAYTGSAYLGTSITGQNGWYQIPGFGDGFVATSGSGGLTSPLAGAQSVIVDPVAGGAGVSIATHSSAGANFQDGTVFSGLVKTNGAEVTVLAVVVNANNDGFASVRFNSDGSIRALSSDGSNNVTVPVIGSFSNGDLFDVEMTLDFTSQTYTGVVDNLTTPASSFSFGPVLFRQTAGTITTAQAEAGNIQFGTVGDGGAVFDNISVPEPSSMLLLLFGGIGLLSASRRKRK